MAGAGFKTFNTGDVLTSSDVNTYLMQQTVMVFDDASARSTALGANVAEGMFSYLKDTNLTYRYDGSAWLSDAGTTSPLTTKGDLWTYSSTDARLPVGTNGDTLVADSSTSTGLKWGYPNFRGFRAFRGTTQTLTSATFTKIQLASETFDTNNEFDPTTNYRFTPTVAGYWQITANITFNASTRTIGMIYKNGTEILRFIDAYPAYSVNGSEIVYMNGTTDYIELYAFVTGGSLEVLGDTTWTMMAGEYLGA